MSLTSGAMRLRKLAGRIKRKLLRILQRFGRIAGALPQTVTDEAKYWRSLQREVIEQRDEIRALQERCDALSARTTMLQREIAPLHAAIDDLKRPAD
jgi:ubiquinone biosynthesis protein UbiJ